MSEEKKSVNPFINAAKKSAENPKVPQSVTNQVQQVKFHNQVNNNKPAPRSAGRGR